MTIPEAIEVLRNFKLDMSQPDAFRMVRAIGMAEEALKRRYSTEEILNEVINDVSGVIDEYAKCDNGTHRSGLECARRIIRSHMADIPESNTRENGWIPVKERLPPTENKSYLVTYQAKNGRRYVKEAYCEYAGESPYAAYWTKKNKGEVIAWMPLPEPYQEESGGE